MGICWSCTCLSCPAFRKFLLKYHPSGRGSIWAPTPTADEQWGRPQASWGLGCMIFMFRFIVGQADPLAVLLAF